MTTEENRNPGNVQELFRITKSENTNTVVYEVVFDKENPDKILDVHPYWVRLASEGGAIKELKWYEKKLSHGAVIDEKKDNEILFHVVSLPDYKVRAVKEGDQWRGIVNVDGVQAIITGIYIDVTTVMLFKPEIRSVTISALALDDGREIKKVINP